MTDVGNVSHQPVRVVSRPTGSHSDESSPSRSNPEGLSYQDMAYTVAGRQAQARVIGELVRSGVCKLKAVLRDVRSWYRARKAERETIEALLALDDRLLRDIGFERYQLAAQVHARLGERNTLAPVVAIDSQPSRSGAHAPMDKAA